MEGDPLSTSWETFYLISATFLFKKKKKKKSKLSCWVRNNPDTITIKNPQRQASRSTIPGLEKLRLKEGKNDTNPGYILKKRQIL